MDVYAKMEAERAYCSQSWMTSPKLTSKQTKIQENITPNCSTYKFHIICISESNSNRLSICLNGNGSLDENLKLSEGEEQPDASSSNKTYKSSVDSITKWNENESENSSSSCTHAVPHLE